MNRKEAADHLIEIARKKRFGKKGMRFLLNTASGIPIVGGAIAGVGDMWAEADQAQLNEVIVKWVEASDRDINEIIIKIDELFKEPSVGSLNILLIEAFGDEIGLRLINNRDLRINAVLGPQTRAEFEPFETSGFISISGGTSMTNMGANNRLGDAIEERKRPYGTGNVYELTILQTE